MLRSAVPPSTLVLCLLVFHAASLQATSPSPPSTVTSNVVLATSNDTLGEATMLVITSTLPIVCEPCKVNITFSGRVTPLQASQRLCIDDRLSLSCDEGYEMISPHGGTYFQLTVLCQEIFINNRHRWVARSTGWSPIDQLPSACSLQLCPSLAITNAVLSTSNTTYGTAVDVTCRAGYVLQGSASRLICLANETWSDPEPSCRPVKCQPYVKPNTNTSPTQTEYRYAEMVVIACDVGYVLSADNGVTADYQCGQNETWHSVSGTGLFDCRPIRCLAPTSSHGQVVLHADGPPLEYGETVNFSCPLGYTLNGSLEAACQANGKWSPPLPTCLMNMCGRGQGRADIPADIAEYVCHCERHHRPVNGSAHTYRLAGGGGWNDTIPVCELIVCPDLPELEHGALAFDVANAELGTVGSTVAATCDALYYLEGGARAVCNEMGTWQPTVSWSCVPHCGTPDPIVNGSFTNGSFTAGNTVRYSCNSGFLMFVPENTSIVISCGEDCLWNATAPTCLYIDCGDVNVTDDALDMTISGSGLDGRIDYSCPDEYRPSTTRSQCTQDGTWQPLPKTVTCAEDRPLSMLTLIYIIVPSVIGTTALLILLVATCCLCMTRRKRRRRKERAHMMLMPMQEMEEGDDNTNTSSIFPSHDQRWLYDGTERTMANMTIARPGLALPEEIAHGTPHLSVQARDGSVMELVDMSPLTLGHRMSTLTMTTTLPAEDRDQDSTADTLMFNEEQLALFSNSPADALDPTENVLLRAELDDIIRQSSKRRRKHRRQQPQLRGSESDISSHCQSSLSRAPSETSRVTTITRNSSLSHRNAALLGDGDDSETPSGIGEMEAGGDGTNPYMLSDIQRVMGDSSPAEENTPLQQKRPSTISHLIQKYNAQHKGSPMTAAKVLASADEISEAYDTPDRLPRQVARDDTRPSGDQAAAKRRNDDNLPPLPQAYSTLNHAGSNKELATSGGSEAALSTDDAVVNTGYEDLKAVRRELREQQSLKRPDEPSLVQMIEDDNNLDSDSDEVSYEKLGSGRGASGDGRHKDITPYADLRKIREQLEMEVDSDCAPYAQVPPMFGHTLGSDGGPEDDEEDSDAKPYARVPTRMSVISSDDRETVHTVNTSASFRGRSNERLSEDGGPEDDEEDSDAKPYARVPTRMSVISIDDRETVNTVTTSASFRGRSNERLSEDDGISTASANTARAAESEGSPAELHHLEVIVDQPQREGERTPPYAKVLVTTKKKSSVTLPASARLLAAASRRPSFGEDSGVPDSDDVKRKNAPPPTTRRDQLPWRKARSATDQWSSDESDSDLKELGTRCVQTLAARLAPAAEYTVPSRFRRDPAAGKSSTIVLGTMSMNTIADSPAHTPEVPRRTVKSRFMDHDGHGHGREAREENRSRA